MSKINILSNLKSKLKSFFVAIFCLLAIFSQVNTYPHIPLKGLFEVLKVDDIGFAHTLLHSQWIENVYQYGAGKPHRQVAGRRNRMQWKAVQKNDPVADLVRLFWFRASEDHQLLPTQFGPLANIPKDKLGVFFGKLINYVYPSTGSGQVKSKCEEALIDELLKYDPEYMQFRQELTVHWKGLIDEEYKLKDEKFSCLQGSVGQRAREWLERETKALQEQYKITELNNKIAQASKKWGKKKGFSKVKKTIEKEYDAAGYYRAMKEAKERAFEGVSREIKGEYDKTQAIIKKIDAAIIRMSKKKIDAIKKALFDPICQALTLCKKNTRYAPRITEGILWALFFHKLDSLVSLEEKIKAINACLNEIDNEFKSEVFCFDPGELKDLYSKEDFDTFKNHIKVLEIDEQIEAVSQNYDIALHYFISLVGGKFPPVIGQGNYGYEYEPVKLSGKTPDCHETATLDAISVLWYNPQIRAFDDSLFSKDVIKNGQGLKKLREALKYFYLADVKKIKSEEYTCEYMDKKQDGTSRCVKFTSLEKLKSLEKITEEEVQALDISEISVSYIKRSEIKQEFFNIVSGIPGVIYCSEVEGKGKIFELDSDVRNVIKIFNYFYGTSVQNIEDLGDKIKGISTDSRIVTFEPENDKHIRNKITISVNDYKNCAYFDMEMDVNGGHTNLEVPSREQKSSKFLKIDFLRKFFKESSLDLSRRNTILNFGTSKKWLKEKEIKWSLPALNQLYYALEMKRVEVALDIIESVLAKHPQYYDDCKEMVYNLMEKVPHNDQQLKARLGEIIICSGFYERESFKDFVKLQVLSDSKFYDNRYRVDSMLDKALEQKYEDIVLQMVDHPQFTRWGYALKCLVEKKYKEIALRILDKEAFDPTQEDVGKALALSLNSPLRQAQGGRCEEISTKILEDPRFNRWPQAVGFALKESLEDIALQLLEHSQCSFSCSGVERGLECGLQQGFSNTVLKVLRHPTFDFFKNDMGEVLKEAMRRGYKKIVSEIIKHPQLNAGDSSFWGVLFLALEKKYKDVALALAKNPTLHVDSVYDMERDLRLALSQGYRDIAVAIAQNPQFNVGHRYVRGLFGEIFKEGHRDIALALFKNPKFDVLWDDKTYAFEHALKNGDTEFVLEMLNRNVLDHWTFVLEKALEAENETIISTILDHPRCCRYSDILNFARKKGRKDLMQRVIRSRGFYLNNVINTMRYWLQEGFLDYLDIILEFVKHPKFDAGYYEVRDLLAEALKNPAYKDIALAIVKDFRCQFKTSSSWADGMLLVLAFKNQVDNEVAFAIMEHPNFNGWESALYIALKEGDIPMALAIVNSSAFLRKKQCFDDSDEKAHEVLMMVLKDEKYKEIAVKILNHPGFKRWGAFIGFAIEKALRQAQDDRDWIKEIILQILAHPRCDLSSSSVGYPLCNALRKGWSDIVLKIISHETFDFSKDEMGGVLRVAIKEGYQEIALTIAKNRVVNLGSYGFEAGDALVAALALQDKQWQDIALALMENPKFNGWARALKKVLQDEEKQDEEKDEKECLGFELCAKIAQMIIKSPYFNPCDNVAAKVLVLALQDIRYNEVALAIMKHPNFTKWGEALEIVLKENLEDIAQKMVQNLYFNPCDEKTGDALVLALKHGYNHVALAIAKHPNANLSRCGWRGDNILVQSLKDQLKHEIAFAIMENPNFIGWGRALTQALKEKREDIVLEIVKNLCFNSCDSEAGEALFKLLQNKKYDIAAKILEHPGFVHWDAAMAEALGDPSGPGGNIALRLIQDSRCDFGACEAKHGRLIDKIRECLSRYYPENPPKLEAQEYKKNGRKDYFADYFSSYA